MLKRLALALSIALGLSGNAIAAVALDGASVKGSSATTSIASAPKTTTGTSDLVVALIAATSGVATVPTITGVSGGGLTWTLRKRLNGTALDYGYATGDGTTCEEWTATATSGLTSQVITATASLNIDGNIQVFAFSGVNTSSPFDANASIPGSQVSSTHTVVTPSISSLSTTTANDAAVAMLCGFFSQGASNFPITNPTGYTAIGNNNNTPVYAGSQAAFDILSGKLSSATVAFGSGYNDFYYIFDAITPAGGAAAVIHNLPLMGVGN